MYLLFFLFLFFLPCLCQLNRSLLNLQFKGFIYPYTIYVLKVPQKYDTIIFQSIGTNEVLPNLTDKDKQYLQKYKHVESFYFLPNFPPTEIIMKENLFLIRSINTNISWTTAYLKQPHLHKFYIENNMTSLLKKQYAGFFHGRQQVTKFQKKYLFDACELWRSWIFVRLEQTEEEFTIFLRREPGSTTNTKKFSFVREYFTTSEIKKMFVRKRSNELLVEIVVISDQQLCLFQSDKTLNLQFQFCSSKQEAIKYHYPISQSQLVLFFQNPITKGVSKFQILSLQQNKTICMTTLPTLSQNQTYIIYKVIHNRIVSCTQQRCHSYSFTCQPVIAIEQLHVNITDIFYERIEHQYLEYVYSTVVIRVNEEIMLFTECDDDKMFEKSINMCKKTTKATTWLDDKYSLLNCYECSRTPNCYYQQNKCVYDPNRQQRFFNSTIYQDKNEFLQHFSRFSAGITSSCPSLLSCTILKNTYQSTIKISQNDQLPIQSTCQLILPVSTESEYLIQLPSLQNKFDIQICSSDFKDTQFICSVQDINLSNIKSGNYKVFSSNYILFMITARSGGPNWNQLLITNLYEQSLYSVTMIFIKFAAAIVVATLFIAMYALLRNRIMARLALWGWIQYRHFGKYPLSKSELKLKYRYFIKMGFIKQIPPSTNTPTTKQPQQCCFCLSQIAFDKQIIQIYCRHQFHKSCLMEWFQLEPHSCKCPICKREFDEFEVQRFNNENHVFNRRASVISDITEIGMVGMETE